ncbi:MAG: LptA/OstA family protein [Spirochaetaceae bacterium]|nr:LptA/OstA family protein [Spirochaetaceae bacterium]
MNKKNNSLFFFIIFIISGNYCIADTFTFNGDNFSSVMSKGKEYTILSGNAKIVSGSTVISATKIELYGNNYRFAECTGIVKVQDSKKGLNIVADKMVFDRIEDISRLEGSVVMEDFRNEVIVKGDYLEYLGKTEIATIQIGVRILKEDMACRAEFALYNRKTNILDLSGLPFVYWKGDEYRALKITINLDTDEISLEGRVSGLIHDDDDEDENSEKAEASESSE